MISILWDRWSKEILVFVTSCTLTAFTAFNVIGEGASPPGASPWDSPKLEQAKTIFAFEEHEAKAPRYETAITNWNPVFVACDGVTNFVLSGKSGGDVGTTRSYRGIDGDRWISIAIHEFRSSRATHEFMIYLMSDPPRGKPNADSEVIEPNKVIGYRCFRGAHPAIGEEILFIRNNICIIIFGKGVKVETLARDLDRQIVEISKEIRRDNILTLPNK